MISCVLFRNAAGRVPFSPKDGQKVRVRGDLSVYARRGNYQIIVSAMSLTGEGDILLMLEERKRKLAAEGLFDSSRKKPLPLFPSRVAVVTSPTGAAIRDILTVLDRRRGGISVAHSAGDSPGRGGGPTDCPANPYRQHSLTGGGADYRSRRGFSGGSAALLRGDRRVGRWRNRKIPVISAVGHEVDWALSDFAADLRAPTPSAAAEAVSASMDELVNRNTVALRHLTTGIQNRLQRTRLVLDRFSPLSMERTLLSEAPALTLTAG